MSALSGHTNRKINMRVFVKKNNVKAVLPEYMTVGSGAFDLSVPLDAEQRYLYPGETVTIDLGLAFEIPQETVMLITGRSGMGFKYDVRLANCLGVIDSDYRDSVKVKLTHDGREHHAGKPIAINPGDRIAQAFILPRPQIIFSEVDQLGVTDRNGGFGSTGGFGN
jgi:dUTP pyrophosphatase